jgi:hypothetical protein
VEARSHGSELAAHNPGNFLVRHVLDEPEHQHFAVLRNKCFQRDVNALCIFRREVSVVAGQINDVVVREWAMGPSPSQLAKRSITGEAIDPGAEGTRVEETRESPKSVQPHILKCVFRGLDIAEQLPEIVAQSGAVAIDKLLERRRISGLTAMD